MTVLVVDEYTADGSVIAGHLVTEVLYRSGGTGPFLGMYLEHGAVIDSTRAVSEGYAGGTP